MESNNTEKLYWTGPHSRKDFLSKIEAEIQQYWESKSIFDVDATETDDTARNKYYITVPPVFVSTGAYVDLPLYRAEFIASYQRLRGKNVLFSFGINKAGIPILFKQFEEWREEQNKPKDYNETNGDLGPKFKRANESRAHWMPAKVKELALSDHEISTLTEERLIEILVNKFKKQVRALGFKIDLRRSFESWSSLYGSFLKWQFTKLSLNNRLVSNIRYGRYSVNQKYFLTSDQDLSQGEGLPVTKFVLVKQKLLSSYPKVISEYEGRQAIYLLTFCPRPGLAVYGQTNIWVLPEEEYGLYEFKDNNLFVCSAEVAINLAHQFWSSTEFGVVKCLKSFNGAELIGAKAESHLSNHKEVYIWPAVTNEDCFPKGLGISCPSINVLDCYLWKCIREDIDIRKKFNLDDSQIMPFEILDLITTQRGLLRDLDIKTLKSDISRYGRYGIDIFTDGGGSVPLANIEGFTVEDFTTFLKKKEAELVAEGRGIEYHSTARPAILRTRERCIVAGSKTNSINYGDNEWYNRVRQYMEKMGLRDEERNLLEREALNGLVANVWHFTRDWNFLSEDIFTSFRADVINIVSSSTMCSVFTSIYHLIARYDLEPKDLTFDVYEYIVGNSEAICDTSIDKDVLDELRKEFKYWMPSDVECITNSNIRSTGLCTIFDNIEILGEEYCPKSFFQMPATFRRGYRRDGDFSTYLQTYPSDAIRLVFSGLLDSSDNALYYYHENDMQTSVVHLTKEFSWIQQIYNSEKLADNVEPLELPERLFAAQINQAVVNATDAFENNKIQLAVTEGFHQLMNYRDNYRTFCESAGKPMNKALTHRYIRTLLVMISPICPHIAEYVWLNILKESDSILRAKWPVADPIDDEVLHINEYLKSVVSIAQAHKNVFIMKQVPKRLPGILEHAVVAVTNQYQGICADALKVYYDYISEYPNEYPMDERGIAKLMSTDPHTRPQKAKAIQFMNSLKGRICWMPGSIMVIDAEYRFNEKKVLEENKKYLASKFGVKQVMIIEYTPHYSYEGVAQPYAPIVMFNDNPLTDLK